jgi:V/A-type H+-transporting ATPase subunit K
MKSKRILACFAVSGAVLWLCPGGWAAPAAAGVAAPCGNAVGLGFAAALTMALCVLGSAYAVGRIGSAAMGAAAEKPELLIRSLLFVALAEGLAVLGFVVSMMMLQKI